MRDDCGAPDAARVEALAAIAARESHACGVNWVFSPCVAVPHDLRWGRTYEGFSEDASIVGELGAAEVRGLQRAGVPVAACLKHWVGDGGTAYGSGTTLFAFTGAPTRILDQGDCVLDEVALRDRHVAAYLPGLDAGCLTVMASYSSYGGVKVHRHRRLLTEVLKRELGFDGIVVSDYNALNQLDGCASFGDAFAQTVNAGIDMVMTAGGLIGFANDLAYEAQIEQAIDAVRRALVPAERIDDAVKRIVRVKLALKLLAPTPSQSPSQSPGGGAEGAGGVAPPTAPELDAVVGCAEHRLAARAAVSASVVLLKNERATLPLKASADGDGGGSRLVVTGRGAHDLGMQCGGWSLSWQGQMGNSFTAGETVWDALRARGDAGGGDATLLSSWEAQRHTLLFGAAALVGVGVPAALAAADVVVVVVGEMPYAEGGGDTHEPRLASADARLIAAVADGKRRIVVVLLCGRPLVIPPATLALIDALAVAWLPGTEGAGVADVLYGDRPPTGRLGFAWPAASDQAAAAAAADECLARAKSPRAAWRRGADLYPVGHGLVGYSA